MGKLFFLVALLALGVNGCAARKWGADTERVQYKDKAPTGDQTKTQARLFAMNEWAQKLFEARSRDADDYPQLLEKHFASLNVKDYHPLGNYTINLAFGNECFNEVGLFNSDLKWDAHKDAMVSQIESVTNFVFQFHKSMLGKSRGPFSFNEVEICTEKVLGQQMAIQGRKLMIGVPMGFDALSGDFTNFKPLSSYELLRQWNEGELFWKKKELLDKIYEKLSPSRVKQLWVIFNPIGFVRTELRELLFSQGGNLRALLQKYLQGKNSGGSLNLAAAEDPLLAEIKNLVSPEKGIISKATSLKSGQIVSILSTLATQGKLGLLLKNWDCNLQNKSLADDLSFSGLSEVNKFLNNSQTDVKIKFNGGLIAIGNYHDISVDGSFVVSPYDRYFRPNTHVINNNKKLDVELNAKFLQIFTTDIIDVKALLSILKSGTNQAIETLTFDKAIELTQANKTCM